MCLPGGTSARILQRSSQAQFGSIGRRLIAGHADTEQGLDHPKRIPEEDHLGAFLMRPTHRDFRDPHPEELSGEIENLHIEGEMIYLAAAENTFGGITREELKAALRVVDAGNSHQLDHLVEGASAKFAQDGLS